MKRILTVLAIALLATTVCTVTSDARPEKVMVVHITSTDIIPGEPGTTYPDPGGYVRRMTGKVIEVAEPAANVLVGKGDVLVEDLYGEDDELPQKGDVVEVAQIFVVNEDGSETNLGDPFLVQ